LTDVDRHTRKFCATCGVSYHLTTFNSFYLLLVLRYTRTGFSAENTL